MDRDTRRFLAYARLLRRKARQLPEFGHPEEQRVALDPRAAEARELVDRATFQRMVFAARCALCDYEPYRAAADRADRAAKKIAALAEQLRRELDVFHASTPEAVEQHLFSLPALLGLADDNPASLPLAHVRMTDLLGTLADHGRAFRFADLPIEDAILAALPARSNPKTQYLRAFLAELRNHHIDPTDLAVRKAAALIATIACDRDITRDDVDKLLK